MKTINMEKHSLSALETEFRSLVERLDVEPYYKKFHTSPQHDGSPHIEITSGQFEFVVTERGSESQRTSGISNDEVLYLLFEGITATMAGTYELRNRKPSGDGRAIWFPYQEELMGGLRPAWRVRLKAEHEHILQKFPLNR